MRLPLARTLVPVVVAVALLAACSDDEATPSITTSERSEPTTATTDASTTTTSVSAYDDVLVAYQAAKEAISPAFDPPNPEDPGILATYTGDALSRLQASIEQLQDQGLGGRNTFESNPTVPTITGDTATLTDCFVDRTEIYNLADGQVQGPPEETIRLIEVTLQRVDGTWRIARSERTETACTPG